jgi:hypothetical protein
MSANKLNNYLCGFTLINTDPFIFLRKFVGFKDEKKAPKNRGFNRIGGAGGN